MTTLQPPPAFRTSNLSVQQLDEPLRMSVQFDLVAQFGQGQDITVTSGDTISVQIAYDAPGGCRSAAGHTQIGALDAAKLTEGRSITVRIDTEPGKIDRGTDAELWSFEISGEIHVSNPAWNHGDAFAVSIGHRLAIPRTTLDYLNLRMGHPAP